MDDLLLATMPILTSTRMVHDPCVCKQCINFTLSQAPEDFDNTTGVVETELENTINPLQQTQSLKSNTHKCGSYHLHLHMTQLTPSYSTALYHKQ